MKANGFDFSKTCLQDSDSPFEIVGIVIWFLGYNDTASMLIEIPAQPEEHCSALYCHYTRQAEYYFSVFGKDCKRAIVVSNHIT